MCENVSGINIINLTTQQYATVSPRLNALIFQLLSERLHLRCLTEYGMCTKLKIYGD